MYGVWFFANCVRGALSISVLMMLWLWNRGDYKGGVMTTWHCTPSASWSSRSHVFWAYVTFSSIS